MTRAHVGNPCIFCKLLHDEVSPGDCPEAPEVTDYWADELLFDEAVDVLARILEIQPGDVLGFGVWDDRWMAHTPRGIEELDEYAAKALEAYLDDAGLL